MSKKKTISGKETADAVTILNRRFGDSPERQTHVEQMMHDMAVGRQIYEARKSAGLTQSELAEHVGTTQSVISDLEDAEYEGHSLSMLRRIASALNLTVKVNLVPAETPTHT